jgi:hypothetical protein
LTSPGYCTASVRIATLVTAFAPHICSPLLKPARRYHASKVRRAIKVILLLVPLVLLLATASLWAHSYFARDAFTCYLTWVYHDRAHDHRIGLVTTPGSVHLRWEPKSPYATPPKFREKLWLGRFRMVFRAQGPFYWTTPAVRFTFLSVDRNGGLYMVQLPLWAAFVVILGLNSALAVILRRARRKRRRAALGLCARCGYDLRATPDRCPECGAVATPLAEGSNTSAQPPAAATA